MVSYSQNIVEASFISQTAPASTIWLDFFVTTWTQYWYLLFAASWVAWEIERMIITFYLHKPNIEIVSKPTLIGTSITSFQSIFKLRELVDQGYVRARGKAFAVPRRDRYFVVVSSKKQIEEINDAPMNQLSARGVMYDVVVPQYIIAKGLDLDVKTGGYIARNVFKHRLRASLPSLQERLWETVQDAFRKEMHGPVTNEGWMRIPLRKVSLRLSGRVNDFVLFGEELASNSEFFQSNMNFCADSAVTMAVLHRVPKFLYGGRRKMKQFLTTEVQKRLESETKGESTRKDCMQWIIETSGGVSIEAIVVQLLTFVLGSRHQLPMLLSYVLYNLCLHQEYIQPLRDEISRVGEKGFETAQNNEMPYLDSFLKEVARTNPLTDVAMPRKVMSSFTFDDGTHVPIGNYVCVPHAPIMNNPAIYPDPETFDGFRFVSKETSKSMSRLTHTSADFPFWGSVKQGCPCYPSSPYRTAISNLSLNQTQTFKLSNKNIESGKSK
ncbi:hypothetical protein EYC84_007101 [Monilinia fructicola]|uniref:Cytochrome P450 n=1 Tax=Monilinia fructicola TaxID=38448 RepID=A0A5M9KA22_MONFR|nr:hypothetical protein EYC84_007101 [Monilinia fructicola]